jgi:type II secretory pathway component PulJ
MVEMMISIAIFSLIGLTVGYLVLVSARASHDATRFIRTEAQARLVVDNIRRETLVGEFLSVQVKDDGRTVEFYDPVTKTTADLRYTGGILLFRQDKDGGVTRRYTGISDVRFSLLQEESMLEFQVTADAQDAFQRTRPITVRDRIFLRNNPGGA